MKRDGFNLGAEVCDIMTRCDGILAVSNEAEGRVEPHVVQLLTRDIRAAATRIEMNAVRPSDADALVEVMCELYELSVERFHRVEALLRRELELARASHAPQPEGLQ